MGNQAKSKIKACVIANVTHLEQAKKEGVACLDLDGVKKFNKQAKPVKKWARSFDVILVSETLNKQVVAQIGKFLSSVHRLPVLIGEKEQVKDKIKEIQYSCRWRMKKVPWLAQGVGIDTSNDESLRQNINKALNFLISLLPKGWHNIRTAHIK